MNKKFTSRKIRDCNFEGVKFIEQDAYQDHRGYYYTIYDNTIDSKNNYVRDKISSSSKNVLRGIHGDYKTTKLITVFMVRFIVLLLITERTPKLFQNGVGKY